MDDEATKYAREAAERIALAREQADIFEAIRRRDGPGRQTTRERFDALMVDAQRSSLEDVLAALVDFARPALEHSQLPEEMAAWVTRVGDYHVVFYGSTPSAGSWIEGEHTMERFGELPHYFHLEHDKKDPRFDRLVEWTGEELRLLSRDHSDYDQPFFTGGKRVDQNDPWRYLHERTGVGLADLRAAIATGEPRWLVCRGLIVLAGVERNPVPVRQRVEEPPPPPPAPTVDLQAVLSEAEQEWIARFDGKIFSYARKVARPELAPQLTALLTAKGPKPRTSRIALAALGMLGVEARLVVPWLAKTSETLRAAAMGSLASMDEAAREALVEGARSRKKGEKAGCTALLRVLDHPSFREVKAARARVPEDIKERLASRDLLAINVQDLDWKERDAERSRLVQEGGAGVGLWYLGHRIARDWETLFGIQLSYEGVVGLMENDPLGPFAVALFLLERPLGDSMFHGEASRTSIVKAAKQTFGRAFGAAMKVTA